MSKTEDARSRAPKAHDLITSPAYVVIKAADQFHTRTTRPNEMWETDFTYCAPRAHMTGMQRRKEEKNECLAPCCEGA